MVMSPKRTRPKTDCNANYRPVLLSERAPHFRIKAFSDQGKKRKNLVKDPKGKPDTKKYWSTDRQQQNKPNHTEVSCEDGAFLSGVQI
jgi:hypothetical protein